jgi:hypothetical protein
MRLVGRSEACEAQQQVINEAIRRPARGGALGGDGAPPGGSTAGWLHRMNRVMANPMPAARVDRTTEPFQWSK